MVMTMPRPAADLRRTARAAAALVAACLASAASARQQGGAPPAAGSSQLPERVDAGVGDRHSLGQSLRIHPVDLSPHGFRNVYKVPGRDDLLMRTDGALYAVFDQSVYVRDPNAKTPTMKAMIPAATVFYIGKPDFRMIRSSGIRDLSFRREDSPPAAEQHAPRPVGGVKRLEPETCAPGATRLEPTRISAKPPEPSDAHVTTPARPPQAPDRPAAPAAEPPTPTRAERPGFDRRIDELMDRAKKAQPGTP